MTDKEISKKYLISSVLLYFAGAIIIFALASVLNGINGKLSAGEIALIVFLCPVLSVGSYTGVVRAGLKINELKSKSAALLIVLLPLVLVFVTVYGIIMIIPTVISSVKKIVRG